MCRGIQKHIQRRNQVLLVGERAFYHLTSEGIISTTWEQNKSITTRAISGFRFPFFLKVMRIKHRKCQVNSVTELPPHRSGSVLRHPTVEPEKVLWEGLEVKSGVLSQNLQPRHKNRERLRGLRHKSKGILAVGAHENEKIGNIFIFFCGPSAVNTE